MTRATLSRKELTATRSIRLVAALYSTRTTESCSEPGPDTVAKCRVTKEDSSLSTWRARKATDARRASGKGMSRVLRDGQP